MTLSELLNSDLSTILREVRRGYDWWLEELAALVPLSLGSWSTRASTILVFDGINGFRDTDRALSGGSLSRSARSDATILIGHDEALVRSVATPPMTRSDLGRMLALNTERYFPLPGGSVLLATAPGQERREDGMQLTDIAAIPKSKAQAMCNAITDYGIGPQSIRVAQADMTPDPRFDFLPAMRAAGMIENSQASAQIWWTVVALLALLNLATAIWRDSADVDRLQALADSQRPAVAVAQRMAARIRSTDAIAQRATARRDPLAVLAQTTAAIPDGAWVQRYAWDGATLRLTGYRSRDTDVAAALRRVSGFTNVKSAQTDSIAETATGQPFDLVVKIGGR